jgi:hypothetical protein
MCAFKKNEFLGPWYPAFCVYCTRDSITLIDNPILPDNIAFVDNSTLPDNIVFEDNLSLEEKFSEEMF